MGKRSKWRGVVQPGIKFGFLKVVGGETADRHGVYVECECSCGHPKCKQNVTVRVDHMVKGESRSCGHATSGSMEELAAKANYPKTYRSYQKMMDRCYNPKHPAYDHYGGRGVSVCEEWQRSFASFARNMGERPNGLTLERINTNGNYEPGNCRWATMTEQNRNKTNGTELTYRGETRSVTEWSETLGIPRPVLFHRIRDGWSVEDAIERPVRLRRWAKRPIESV